MRPSLWCRCVGASLTSITSFQPDSVFVVTDKSREKKKIPKLWSKGNIKGLLDFFLWKLPPSIWSVFLTKPQAWLFDTHLWWHVLYSEALFKENPLIQTIAYLPLWICLHMLIPCVGSVCEHVVAAHKKQCQLVAWNGTYRFFNIQLFRANGAHFQNVSISRFYFTHSYNFQQVIVVLIDVSISHFTNKHVKMACFYIPEHLCVFHKSNKSQ